MPGALNLRVRNPVEVMRLVAAFYADTPDVEVTFEGDLSAIDWLRVPSNALRDDKKFVAVPLKQHTLAMLTGSVFPRVGLRSRVWHVIVRRGGERLFASYDNLGPGMVVVESLDRERLCAQLRAAGLIIHRRVVVDS